jgi:hypothetical protein
MAQRTHNAGRERRLKDGLSAKRLEISSGASQQLLHRWVARLETNSALARGGAFTEEHLPDRGQRTVDGLTAPIDQAEDPVNFLRSFGRPDIESAAEDLIGVTPNHAPHLTIATRPVSRTGTTGCNSEIRSATPDGATARRPGCAGGLGGWSAAE